MVTLAEFLRHVLTSAIVMGIGVGALVFVNVKYSVGRRALRRMSYWYVGLVALIAGLSYASTVTESRCRTDKLVRCRVNDSVPFMAVIVFVFVVVCFVRAWVIRSDR